MTSQGTASEEVVSNGSRGARNMVGWGMLCVVVAGMFV
jgi:hypothetical protein